MGRMADEKNGEGLGLSDLHHHREVPRDDLAADTDRLLGLVREEVYTPGRNSLLHEN